MLQPAPPPALARPVPPSAPAAAREGHVKLRCVVSPSGEMRACEVLEERPAGYGFGAAAIRTTASMRTTPPTRDGRPVEGVVTVPFTFRVDGK